MMSSDLQLVLGLAAIGAAAWVYLGQQAQALDGSLVPLPDDNGAGLLPVPGQDTLSDPSTTASFDPTTGAIVGGISMDAAQAVPDQISFLPSQPVVLPPPAPVFLPRVPAAPPPESPYLSPEEAYTYIRQGRYSKHVVNARISRFYLWSDVFVSGDKPEDADMSHLQNAARHALNMDQLCVLVGRGKIEIVSWFRSVAHQKAIYKGAAHVPLNSRHLYGDACDLQGSEQYKMTTLLPKARQVKGFGGIGYSTPGHVPFVLHVDSRPLVYGQRVVFQDNATGTGPSHMEAV